MDNGNGRGIVVDLAGLPVNMRESDHPKLREQYVPFSQLMKNLAKQKAASSSSEEEHSLKPKSTFKKTS